MPSARIPETVSEELYNQMEVQSDLMYCYVSYTIKPGCFFLSMKRPMARSELRANTVGGQSCILFGVA